MTYAPSDLLAVRTWLLGRFDINKGLTRAADLDPAEVGIVGDSAHKASGGYHCGNNWLADVGRRDSDYSKRESVRDRPGTNAASALDIGDFANGPHNLRTLSVAIADACRRGDPRARDVREVIYSADGRTVRRWDRLGLRATGGSDHTWHTHISFHRDSEGRRDRDDNFLGLIRAIVAGTGTPATSQGDDMYSDDDRLWDRAEQWRVHDVTYMRPTFSDGADKGKPVPIVKAITDLAAAVAAIKDAQGTPTPVNVDAAAVAAALGSDTAFLAAVAKAVADENARRQKD